MSDYVEFLASKRVSVRSAGFDVAPGDIHPLLFDWQREIVRWSLRLGRAALFEECGLGKTLQQLEWARHVAAHTGGKVLILAPLAVAHQTVAEGHKLDLAARYCRTQAEAAGAAEVVIVTNYDMLKEFDARQFAGVALDESSLLKAFTGATKRTLIKEFSGTPFRLCCTATPAPNDTMELGNHAEFLGLMASNEMIMRWFINNTMAAGDYRLKRHAEADFWRWVASWAVCASHPSDLGYSDEGFILPEMRVHAVPVAIDPQRAFDQGQLFLDTSLSATDMWRDKAHTAEERCRKAAALVDADPLETWIVWCETNQEADILKRLLPQAVEVRGSESVSAKEAKLTAFSDGRARVIITKPDIAAFGLNWQHCARQVFVSVSFSFERTYQAMRRSWRFGQVRPVDAYLVCAESETGILQALRAKQEAHQRMQRAMNAAMRGAGLLQGAGRHELVDYHPQVEMRLPEWLGVAA